MSIHTEDILKALAHPVRREILSWLKAPEQHFAGQEHPLELGVCAGQFERCGLSQSTVSTHLGILQRAGLVQTRRVGQWIFYQRNEATIAEFVKTLQAEL
ncbi:ArsR/SmtB family transcription factor [Bordetella genomosp. 12]|uniref:Transcriptional regulator n=1 Tax=Bordetella genomosp. 12 TaxID=463035 RepID=A0A261VB92_9BORD|nr:metalloregulator ArsR/SmtB family transcription factor [Bordetella genomosp. 12]OZI71265.1 transcriptional regulator [Bordetella genomosp. 12]